MELKAWISTKAATGGGGWVGTDGRGRGTGYIKHDWSGGAAERDAARWGGGKDVAGGEGAEPPPKPFIALDGLPGMARC